MPDARPHGRRPVILVSPAVDDALYARQRETVPGLCRRRYVWVDEDVEYPPFSMRLDGDCARAGGVAGNRVHVLRDLDGDWIDGLEGECDRCLEAWLQLHDVDLELPLEEREFVRIRDALRDLLAPTLRPFFMPERPVGTAVVTRPARLPATHGVTAERERPLVASMQNPNGSVIAMCGQRDGTLHCTSSVMPANALTIEGPSVTVSAALDNDAQQTLRAWAQEVVTFLAPHADTFDLRDRRSVVPVRRSHASRCATKTRVRPATDRRRPHCRLPASRRCATLRAVHH